MRRVIITDDEPLGRERLKWLLGRHPGYVVVAECASGEETLERVDAERPDVLFLDIRMPGLSGIDVAHALVDGGGETPLIVFVTAYDDFAVAAFDVSAVDYLVKPVDIDRFDRMIARLDDRIGAPPDDNVRTALAGMPGDAAAAKRFVVRGPQGYYFVKVEEIESATAEGNYVALAARGRRHLVRATMHAIERKTDPAQFIRIHRSIIINVDHITLVEPLGHSDYRVTMKSGARFTSSRSYSDRFRTLVGREP